MSRHPKPPGHSPSDHVDADDVQLPPAAISARNLSKDYGDGPALFPLTLRIEKGERVALIGHNGSGKTTFLRLASGLLQPDTGSVNIDGHPTGSLEARRELSFIADSPTFYDDLSVWEHLEYTARLHGMTNWEQRAADLLGTLGLYERADDLPNRFSRGLKQKAAIALAFVRPFTVLCVDEPFVGLDADGKEALLSLFDQAQDAAATLVVATHELGFVTTAQRTIALRDGRLIFDGDSSDKEARRLVAAEDWTSSQE